MKIKSLVQGVALGLLVMFSVFPLRAQTYANLHVFSVPPEVPYAGLTQGPDGFFYGVASEGGLNGQGAVFKVLPNGKGFTNIYSFHGTNDGGAPFGNLVLSDGLLYGTASAGGDGTNGTIFAVDTNGGNFQALWSFSDGATNANGIITNLDGASPQCGLVLENGMLYGTTFSGGTGGNGVVFALSTNGGDLTALYQFSAGTFNSYDYVVNPDGATPVASLLLNGTQLYGAAYQGGSNGNGTIFSLGTNGAGFTVLKTFTAVNPNNGANADGANPVAALTLSGTTLYGAALYGGAAGNGTIFALYDLGVKFTNLYHFSALAGRRGVNHDGAYPNGQLVLAGNFLYGTTYDGGVDGFGSIFGVNTSGLHFTNYHSFAAGTDGANSTSALTLAGPILYGTTTAGGDWGFGTAFSVNTNKAGFTNFYQFASADGGQPLGGLTLAGNTFYGAAASGGSNNTGLLYTLNSDGSDFAPLKDFSAINYFTGANTTGSGPQGNLVVNQKWVYGSASSGGAHGNGAIFALETNGQDFKLLWSAGAGMTNSFGLFANANGAFPLAGLTQVGSELYGTASAGGAYGAGGVFVIKTNGTGFKLLTHFSAGRDDQNYYWTNKEGGTPAGALVVSGNQIYGTTYQGGSNGNGTLFVMETNGTGYTLLKTFPTNDPVTLENTDGADPVGGLTLSGGTLFGSAVSGGTGGSGTIFTLSTNGTGYQVLYSFSTLDTNTLTNVDGAFPSAGLLLAEDTLYGTTPSGGLYGCGTIFSVTTNGNDFTVLRNLTPSTDGSASYATLFIVGDTLFGSTSAGGPGGGGTVFELGPLP